MKRQTLPLLPLQIREKKNNLCHSVLDTESALNKNVKSKKDSESSSEGHKIKAFTLVELIVVITILVILGTISFISLQGYSKDTRDVKRISDVRSLLTKITTEHTRGVHLENIMDIENKKTNNLIIDGDKKEGEQGIINFQTLGEQSSLFKDPSNNQDYPFAYAIGTTDDDEKYEFIGLATVMETEQKTIIMGNYFKYKEGDSKSLFTNKDGKEIENESKDLIYNLGEEIGCNPQTIEDNYILENGILHKEQITLSKAGNENNGIIEHGSITKEQDYQCNMGILEKVGEERTITNCINEENQEYIPDGLTCVASLCDGELPDNAEQNGQQTNQGTWHYSTVQTQCGYKCADGYMYDDTTKTCDLEVIVGEQKVFVSNGTFIVPATGNWKITLVGGGGGGGARNNNGPGGGGGGGGRGSVTINLSKNAQINVVIGAGGNAPANSGGGGGSTYVSGAGISYSTGGGGGGGGGRGFSAAGVGVSGLGVSLGAGSKGGQGRGVSYAGVVGGAGGNGGGGSYIGENGVPGVRGGNGGAGENILGYLNRGKGGVGGGGSGIVPGGAGMAGICVFEFMGK